MEKKSILMLIALAILITGVIIAGCTQDSGSVSQKSSVSSGSSAVETLTTSPTNQVNNNDRLAFNQSGLSNGTPPSGMMMNNRTHPSGPPPGGMMNGTRPSGPPPGGMMNGTPPPASGMPPSGSQI